MLTATDAALALRDPALPDLDRLLDDEQIAGLLQAELGLNRDQLMLRSNYIRYKPGTSCLVGFEGVYRDQPVCLYARLHPASEQSKAAKALNKPLAASPLGPGALLLLQSRLLLMLFPNDHELRILREISEPEQRSRCLQHLLPAASPSAESRLERLNYKPERRYVGKLSLADGRCFLLKAYDRTFARGQRLSANAFQGDGQLHLRRRLCSTAKHDLALYPWLDGTPLSALNDLALLEQVGALLARLHSHNQQPQQHGFCGAQSSTDKLKRALDEAVQSLATIAPMQLDRVRNLAATLLSSWAAQPESQTSITCLIHGDFSSDQIILSDDTIWLIDFDRSSYDHPIHDLGSFLARLHYQNLANTLSASDCASWSRACIQGYLKASAWPLAALIPASLGLHLFKLAPEAFRQRKADWWLQIDRVLSRIEAVLRGDWHVA